MRTGQTESRFACCFISNTQLTEVDVLVAQADVLRLEDLSVGRFAADDDIQLVDRLDHSPGQKTTTGNS